MVLRVRWGGLVAHAAAYRRDRAVEVGREFVKGMG